MGVASSLISVVEAAVVWLAQLGVEHLVSLGRFPPEEEAIWYTINHHMAVLSTTQII